jgi:ferric-dicitrate binding protein FerR (iron transport regulator)
MREDAVMPQSNEALQRKRRRKAVPVLGAAGLSLALTSGASAAVDGMSVNLPARTALGVSQQMTLRDEEITDVSLATFHVFDKENTQRPRTRVALGATLGACGSSFYENPPVSSGPAYPPPPVRRTNKYRHSPKRT